LLGGVHDQTLFRKIWEFFDPHRAPPLSRAPHDTLLTAVKIGAKWTTGFE
jgi:hypothetical protein